MKESEGHRPIRVKDIPLAFTVPGWEVARKPVGRDAFIALITDYLGTRVVAVVSGGPRNLGEIISSVAPEKRKFLEGWTVLSQNPFLHQTYQADLSTDPITEYGGGGPMNLTDVKLVSLRGDEVESARASLRDMLERGVRFVKTLEQVA